LYSMVPVGKTPLRINMDETSVCLFQGLGKGIVFIDKKRSPPVQLVATSKRRCCLTHVAFICDRPDIQQVLPQVLIGNETTLPARRLAALRAASPRNVWILRQKSAWNNQFTCAWIMELLAAALAPFTATVQPILLFDAVRIQHNTPRSCRLRAIRYMADPGPRKSHVALTTVGCSSLLWIQATP